MVKPATKHAVDLREADHECEPAYGMEGLGCDGAALGDVIEELRVCEQAQIENDLHHAYGGAQEVTHDATDDRGAIPACDDGADGHSAQSTHRKRHWECHACYCRRKKSRESHAPEAEKAARVGKPVAVPHE